MILRCATCQIHITHDVAELHDNSQLSVEDGKDHLPQGFYRITTAEDDVICGKNELILNLRDLTNTKRHPDYRRSNGCCGCDGLDGLNIVCTNGHEIGTECSDCWMPRYAHIPQDRVERLELPAV